jgi:hypothetical protein
VHDIVREQEGYASIGTSAASLAEAAGACAAPNKLDTHSPEFLEQINASFIKEGVAHPEWLVVWDKARKVDDHRRPRAPPSAESVALILMTYEAAKDCYFAFKRMMHEVVKEVNDHDQSGDASLVEANIAPIKALPRVIEKAVLRPHSGAAWDMIRSQIVCNNCQQIAAVLTRLEERHHKNVDIKVCQVNDRFKNPAAGWADVSLYLSFPKLSDLVCEVQVVHNNLLVAREELGAHDQYADTRFASELLRIKEQIRKEAASEPAPSTDATREGARSLLTRKEPGAPR